MNSGILPANKIKNKPVVSYWKSGDPTQKIKNWLPNLTDINIINTKVLTDEFISICIQNKDKIYLHLEITGMGKTPFEPNIPTVRESFFQIKKLIHLGFPQKQILVIVSNILPNENGLKALKLLLKVFTEFEPLRLRFIRLNVLRYVQNDNGKYTIGNQNILKRPAIKGAMMYLTRSSNFWKDYYKILERYNSILNVDKGEESLIGIRELIAFGYKNEWITPDGIRTKIINYEKNNRFKPVVNLLSPKRAVRCSNRCLLCPWFF